MSGPVMRKNAVKKGIDIDEARRKREENVIELRKNKRDENLLKKRQTFASPQLALEDSNRPGGGAQRVRTRLTCSAEAAVLQPFGCCLRHAPGRVWASVVGAGRSGVQLLTPLHAPLPAAG